jgi:hypothetical protein
VAVSNESFWNLIDAALVINLDQRADRWAEFKAQIRDLIPPHKLHRVSARWGRDLPGYGQPPWFRGRPRDAIWAGRAGCTASHRNALLQAQAANWATTLVLEDDAVFAPDFANILPALAEVLAQRDWQICYLGFTEPWSPIRKLADVDATHGLFEVQGCTTTHAYLVRAAARDWIVAQLPEEAAIWPWVARHRVIDRWYQRTLGLSFPVTCVAPSLITQAPGFSDIAAAVARHHYETDARGVEAMAAKSAAAYYAARAGRRISIRTHLLGDVIRGWARRAKGF